MVVNHIDIREKSINVITISLIDSSPSFLVSGRSIVVRRNITIINIVIATVTGVLKKYPPKNPKSVAITERRIDIQFSLSKNNETISACCCIVNLIRKPPVRVAKTSLHADFLHKVIVATVEAQLTRSFFVVYPMTNVCADSVFGDISAAQYTELDSF